jgi:hypothetical protein
VHRAAATFAGLLCFVVVPAYADPPQLTVASPQDGFVTSAGSVAVTGSAIPSPGAGPVTVTINGVVVPLNPNGGFGGSVVLSAWGNAVTVIAEDALGQVSAVYLNVEQDLVQPNVWFFGADEGQVVNADQLTPNCGASDDFMAFFAATLNGLPFTCGDTIFGFGAYTFAIDAMDQAGNSAHLSTSFALGMPPQLVVTAPTDGLITNVQAFPVQGTVAASPDLGPVTVTVNGTAFAVAPDGTFGGVLELVEGWQAIEVLATDAFGQTSGVVLQVVLDTIPPEVWIPFDDGYIGYEPVVPGCGASDANLASWQATLNGSPISCDDTIPDDGTYTLAMSAVDLAGNSSELTRTFAVDRTPPQISISGVSDGATVAAPASIAVTSTDAHPFETIVILDGMAMPQSFTVTEPGAHALRVESTDLVWNFSFIDIHFTVDPEGLAAQIVSPADGTITDNPSAEIVVAITAGHPISQATANGVALVLQGDGLYHASVSLVEGLNQIQVVVVDATSAQVSRTISIALSSRATAFVAQIASSATAGDLLSLTLRAVDTFANVDHSYRGTVHFTSSDSQATLPGNTPSPRRMPASTSLRAESC